MVEASLSVSSLSLQQQSETLPHFVRPPDDKYECVHCKRTLRPPVKQTQCGHRLCGICVDDVFAEGENVSCPGDEDCDTLTRKQIHPDIAATKELYRMDVYCTFKQQGCDVIVTWLRLQSHMDSCDFAVVMCRNDGCHVTLRRSEIAEHELKLCDYLPTMCENCELMVPKHELAGAHSSVCKPQSRACSFVVSGCAFVGLPAELRKHINECATEHSLQLAQTVATVQQSSRDLQQNMREMNEAFEQLRSEFASEHSTTFETVREKLAQFDANLQQLTAATANKCNKTDVDNITQTVSRLQTQVNAQSVRMEPVQRAAGDTRTDSGQGAGQAEQVRGKVQVLEVKQAENELRFRLIETAGHRGHMIWKITNYRRRKQDAIDGRTLSLYSQPFYTSEYGYKMCARVYLNGDGMGKGTHLSLFFVVMRNEYDALLTWPFQQRVTMALIDQSGQQRHIKDSFRPDPTSTSFRRPSGEMNIASGSPMFAIQERVESDAFLKDDTLFISVHVDTSDIKDPIVE